MEKIFNGLSVIYFTNKNKNKYAKLPLDKEQGKTAVKADL